MIRDNNDLKVEPLNDNYHKESRLMMKSMCQCPLSISSKRSKMQWLDNTNPYEWSKI